MALYKTKNGMLTGSVPGVGEIVDGLIEGPDNLEGPNLVKVDQPQVAPAAPVASPQPTAPNINTPPATPAPVAPLSAVADKENL
jgi:hypothetical protein